MVRTTNDREVALIHRNVVATDVKKTRLAPPTLLGSMGPGACLGLYRFDLGITQSEMLMAIPGRSAYLRLYR